MINNIEKEIITGITGCGKTYTTIMQEKDKERKFCYIAPCRQLVYESYMKYASVQDSLSTGEVKLEGEGNIFAVYESITPKILELEKVQTLIIDEAHFIADNERGQLLQNLILFCIKRGINVKLVTATLNFELEDFTVIELIPKFKVPKKVEVDYNTFKDNIEKGLQTIWFTSSISSTYGIANSLISRGIKAKALNSEMLPSDRLKTQIAFKNKEIQVIVCTNLLGQGVNFECENLYVAQDMFNTPELIEQKLGRLGRPFLSKASKVYYCLAEDKVKIKKEKVKLKKNDVSRDFIQQQLNLALMYLNNNSKVEYNDIKYCIYPLKKEIYTLEQEGYATKFAKKQAHKLLYKIEQEKRNIISILKSNCQYQ